MANEILPHDVSEIPDEFREIVEEEDGADTGYDSFGESDRPLDAISHAADLAIANTDEAKSNGDLPSSPQIRISKKPTAKKNNNMEANRRISFAIKAHGLSFYKTIATRGFSNLGLDVKLQLAVGMLNMPAFEFLDTTSRRNKFLLTMINKGLKEDEVLSRADLQQLFRAEERRGYLTREDRVPKLTEEAMEQLCASKDLQTLSKNPGRPK